MFVAWRELRAARGRFVLIGTVVALITLLVGFLAGLTGGLASQNVSAVLSLPGDRLVLQRPPDGTPSFADSAIPAATVQAWRQTHGVDAVTPVGIIQTRAEGSAGTVAAVALFGVAAGGASAPVTALTPDQPDAVGLSAGAAEELGVTAGDRVTIAGRNYRVALVGDDLWHSHTPVVAMAFDAWAAVDTKLGGTGEATVLGVSGPVDWDAAAAATGTSAATPLRSLTALETFRSEVGSLAVMIAMLFGVSALVVGAFFTVWSMQRAGEVAVLKALGASTPSLVGDALGQALAVLLAGIGAGLLSVVGLGTLVDGRLPFLMHPLTTIGPAAAMVVLGLAGAAVALGSVVRADPLTALGSNR